MVDGHRASRSGLLRGRTERPAETGPAERARQLATAGDPVAAAAALAALALDPDTSVRLALAAREANPSGVWRRLARDADPTVRAAVAGNPAAPPARLTRLAGVSLPRSDLNVVRAVAANPSCPPRALATLASSQRWDVRARVAANPACPPPALRRLASDRDWAVRAAVAESQPAPARWLARFAGDVVTVAFALAGNPATPTAAADRLLTHPDPYVAGRAAGLPHVSADALGQIASGLTAAPWALRRATNNPACPPGLAAELLTWIALGGAGTDNPLFDPATGKDHPGNPDVPVMTWYRDIARHAADPSRHPLWRVRANTLTDRRQAPHHVLRRLARDPRPEVRASTSRFNMPPDISRELRRDADPTVATGGRTALARLPWRKRADSRRARVAIAIVCALALLDSVLHPGAAPDAGGARPFAVPTIPTVPARPEPVTTNLAGGWTATYREESIGLEVLAFSGGTVPLTVTGVETSTEQPGLVVDILPVTVGAGQRNQVILAAFEPSAIVIEYALADGVPRHQTIDLPGSPR